MSVSRILDLLFRIHLSFNQFLNTFLNFKSTKTIDRLISAGKLKPTRLTDKAIRIYGKDLEAFLQTGGVK